MQLAILFAEFVLFVSLLIVPVNAISRRGPNRTLLPRGPKFDRSSTISLERWSEDVALRLWDSDPRFRSELIEREQWSDEMWAQEELVLNSELQYRTGYLLRKFIVPVDVNSLELHTLPIAMFDRVLELGNAGQEELGAALLETELSPIQKQCFESVTGEILPSSVPNRLKSWDRLSTARKFDFIDDLFDSHVGLTPLQFELVDRFIAATWPFRVAPLQEDEILAFKKLSTTMRQRLLVFWDIDDGKNLETAMAKAMAGAK